MKRCFLTSIDASYDPKNDLAIGPWCFEDINELKNISLFFPFEKKEILKRHQQCFDLAYYLLNRDSAHLKGEEKDFFYLKNQVRYLFFTYFAFSRFQLIKKFIHFHGIDNLSFEFVDDQPIQNVSDITPFFDPKPTGWLLLLIIQFLYPNKNNWFYLKKEKKFFPSSSPNHSFQKKSFKSKINYNFNAFNKVPGIKIYYGILLTVISKIIFFFKKKKKPIVHIYNPLLSKDIEINEFIPVFDATFSKYYKIDPYTSLNNPPLKKPNRKCCFEIGSSSDIVYNNNTDEIIKSYLDGTPVIVLQHGGVFATLENHFRRDIEFSFSNFISLGNNYKSYLPIKRVNNKLPSPYLHFLKDSYTYTTQDKILWITGCHYKCGDGLEYLYGLEVLNYLNKKIQLYNSIKKSLQEKIIYKILPFLHDFQFKDPLENLISKKNIISNKKTSIDLMLEAKITILDYYGTPFYEALSMNAPILICYCESVPFFDKKTEDFFNEFKKIGIIHTSTKSLAHFLNSFYDTHIIEWWHSSEVQDLRNKFLNQYANNKNYFFPWLKAIFTEELFFYK